ncbi:lytic murein transglycosylase [Desulfatirhabdium butyrativorans]|uniref:lytic murein transglycosylase n=1 Tax=Desulfatirhabdium butyrativorans TaxID=340467 RepID=UPI00040EE121|nr:lytic murein transglycosylase [Desulfatirhabdium butyrativorans]
MNRFLHKKTILIFLLLMMAPFSGLLSAQEESFQKIMKRLQTDGFDAEKLQSLYAKPEVQFDPQTVSRFFMHSESRVDYSKFLSEPAIQQAKWYLFRHMNELESAENRLGVDKEVITAILLVETRLGNYLGDSSILNTLSSLAALQDNPGLQAQVWNAMPVERRISESLFNEKVSKRSKWAYDELKSLLRYASKEGIDPVSIRGSYAGALGIAQFMPSNILTYGIDGDGDGHVDLFVHSDAIASVANYLKQYGWKKGIDDGKAREVIFHYNHSQPYVDTILKVAQRLKG